MQTSFSIPMVDRDINRYQALLLNNVRDAIVVWDLRGRITFWNPAASYLFGWKTGDCLGRPVSENYLPSFTPPVILPGEGDTIGRYVERQCRTRYGQTIWVSARISTLYDARAGNQVVGYMDVSRDITPQKQMEAQIRGAQTHLIQAARLAMIGEMASGIAHQINNPLTTIIAEAQLLLRGLPVESTAHESAEAIQEAGWRLQEAVQRLLEFSRPAVATLEALSVNQTILRALLLVGAHIEAAGIKLESRLEQDLPAVLGNARQLEDLWVNLLLLARDAIEAVAPRRNSKAHSIHIRTRARSTGMVVVEVRDDGIPVPPDQLATIFEPNFIGPTSGRGTGMELSICREIVRQHGGQVTAESNSDRDTIFSVILPAEPFNSG
jgi:PAS domain S-box-containing protein